MKDMADELPGMERVRARFLSMLLERQIKIADHAIAAWEGETLEEVNDNLAGAQAVLHQIAGTAGSLGFGDLGQEARTCENAIIAHLESPEGDLAVCPAGLIHLLDEFISGCEIVLTPLVLTEDAATEKVEAEEEVDGTDEEIDLQSLKTALI